MLKLPNTNTIPINREDLIMIRYSRLVAALLIVLLLEACGNTPLQKTKTNAETTGNQLNASVVENGKQLFLQYRCVQCHGEDGMSGMIDLSNVAAKYSEDQVKTWIANPRAMNPATGMPAFNMLNDEQLNGLAQFVRSIKKK